jgi:hypothetical protein
MAYYTALITEWATLPGGDTTAQKLAAINAMTVTGIVPTSFTFTGIQLLACLNWTEFASLTAAQQTQILAICALSGNLPGGSSSFVGGMFVAFYVGKLTGPTIVALTALAMAVVTPWWRSNNYTSPINANDLVAAGGLT